MTSNASVEDLLREVRAECYRLVLAVGSEKVPWPFLLIAATHELWEVATEQMLKKMDQPKLPKSGQVLNELWNETVRLRQAEQSSYGKLKRSYSLLCNRLVSPDVFTPQDIAKSQRAIEHLCLRPMPVRTLIEEYCGAFAELDDQQMREIQDRCLVLMNFKERWAQMQSVGTSELEEVAVRSLKLDRCPSHKRLWDRIRDKHITKAPDRDEYTWTRDPQDLNMAMLALFIAGAIIESIEAVHIRFEKSTFLPIAERLDQVFPLPILSPLPAPSGVLAVSLSPPRASLNGQDFNLTDEQAAFVDVLARHRNQWVEPELFDKRPILVDARRDRIKDRLPDPLKGLIKSQPDVGYKLTLA